MYELFILFLSYITGSVASFIFISFIIKRIKNVEFHNLMDTERGILYLLAFTWPVGLLTFFIILLLPQGDSY